MSAFVCGGGASCVDKSITLLVLIILFFFSGSAFDETRFYINDLTWLKDCLIAFNLPALGLIVISLSSHWSFEAECMRVALTYLPLIFKFY